jgi:hypothetical protein
MPAMRPPIEKSSSTMPRRKAVMVDQARRTSRNKSNKLREKRLEFIVIGSNI